MSKITYIGPDESPVEVSAEAGQSVMRAAILNGVDGIIGECGGQAMCATCHVFVEQVAGALVDVSDDEDEMLDCTAVERAENSRLGCQLVCGESFDEIVVRIPETQV